MREAPVVTLRREFSALSPTRDLRADPRTQYNKVTTLHVPVNRGGGQSGSQSPPSGKKIKGVRPQSSSGKKAVSPEKGDAPRLELFLVISEPDSSSKSGKSRGSGKSSAVHTTVDSKTLPLSLEMTAFQAVQHALKLREIEAAEKAPTESMEALENTAQKRLKIWEPVYHLVYRTAKKEKKSPSKAGSAKLGHYWDLAEVEVNHRIACPSRSHDPYPNPDPRRISGVERCRSRFY